MGCSRRATSRTVATPSAINAGVVAIHANEGPSVTCPVRAAMPTRRNGTKIRNPHAAERPIPRRTERSVFMRATLPRRRRRGKPR